jgi:hypothetical protein
MPIPEEDMILSTTDYFVTENRLNPKATLVEIEAFVRQFKTKGHITYTLNGGGLRGAIVVERRKATDAEANEIRRILGMDYEVEVEVNGEVDGED